MLSKFPIIVSTKSFPSSSTIHKWYVFIVKVYFIYAHIHVPFWLAACILKSCTKLPFHCSLIEFPYTWLEEYNMWVQSNFLIMLVIITLIIQVYKFFFMNCIVEENCFALCCWQWWGCSWGKIDKIRSHGWFSW